MTQPIETTTTEDLLNALLAQVEAESAEIVELPEPLVVVPFHTVL
ncbi:hypothetical protein [Methylobacterium mesophilicum]